MGAFRKKRNENIATINYLISRRPAAVCMCVARHPYLLFYTVVMQRAASIGWRLHTNTNVHIYFDFIEMQIRTEHNSLIIIMRSIQFKVAPHGRHAMMIVDDDCSQFQFFRFWI